MTDTADQADYVLPATTQLEHWDVHASYGHTYLRHQRAGPCAARQAAPTRRSSARWRARMGFTEACFADDDETLAREAFKGPVPFEQLRELGWARLPLPEAPFADGGFPTPDGKARCDVPGLGLPDYVPPYESVRSAPELASRFPLAMISPPARNFLNSTFVNVKSLRAIEHEPFLEIAADDAAPRGLADGERCACSTTAATIAAGDQRARAARRRQRPGRVVAQVGPAAPTSMKSRTSS